MTITKKEIAEKTNVTHVRGFGFHAVRSYYAEFSTPGGLIGFEAKTHGMVEIQKNFDGNVVSHIEACITTKKDFVDEVYEYLNK